jgi:hypothetical protein
MIVSSRSRLARFDSGPILSTTGENGKRTKENQAVWIDMDVMGNKSNMLRTEKISLGVMMDHGQVSRTWRPRLFQVPKLQVRPILRGRRRAEMPLPADTFPARCAHLQCISAEQFVDREDDFREGGKGNGFAAVEY